MERGGAQWWGGGGGDAVGGARGRRGAWRDASSQGQGRQKSKRAQEDTPLSPWPGPAILPAKPRHAEPPRRQHSQSLYSSVVERQSCKLKVLGSIPSGGFFAVASQMRAKATAVGAAIAKATMTVAATTTTSEAQSH